MRADEHWYKRASAVMLLKRGMWFGFHIAIIAMPMKCAVVLEVTSKNEQPRQVL